MWITIVGQAVRDLYSQRWRFVLTGTGIAISVALLTVLIGYTTAMNATLASYIGGMASLRTVKAMPSAGTAPTSGLARAITGAPDAPGERGASATRTAVIDSAFIADASAWESVETAFPEVQLPVTVHANGRSISTRATCFNASQVTSGTGPPSTAREVIMTSRVAERVSDRTGPRAQENASVPDSVVLQFREMRLDPAALQSLAGGSLPVGDRVERMRVADVANGASSLLTLQSGVLLHPEACADLYWSGAGGGALVQYRVLGSFPGVNVVAVSADSVAGLSQRLESSGLYVWSVRSIQSRLQQFTGLIEVGLSILGLIGLLISALGLANTILMNVMERRADIGIMRTVGARRKHVAGQFVTQGALMGVVFGGIGIAGGAALMVLAEFVLNQTVFSGLDVNLFEISMSRGLGMMGGVSLFCAAVAVLPARQAARIDPAQAVRSAR
jgi:hypothetical protein